MTQGCKAPGHPYLWAPALNLLWCHKEVGHQEEHIFSLEDKGWGLRLQGSLHGRGRQLAALCGREGALASSSHHPGPQDNTSMGQMQGEVMGGWLSFWPFLSLCLPL